MIKCPSCGYDNVDGTQFCEGCGEELVAPSSAPAASAASSTPAAGAADVGQIKCPACDNLNPSDNVVCEVCGTELRSGALDVDIAPVTAPPSAPAQAVSAQNATPFDTALNAPPVSAPAAPVADPNAHGAAFDFAPADTSPAAAATATSTDATNADVAVSTAAPVSGAPDVPVAAPSATTDAPATSDVPSGGGDLQPGKVKLTVEQGMTIGKQFVLGDVEVLVGREDDEEGVYPDIDLSDQDEGYVHRRHATLNFSNGALTVTHLGGANKSRINNKPLPDNEAQPVKIGDKIAFGKVVLRVGAI